LQYKEKFCLFFSTFICCAVCILSPITFAKDSPSIFDLSLRDLLKIKVSTASKKEETLDESPAFVEIITQHDIQRRGYKDLSYIFDDIAGVQITRGYGDNYFNTIWRGIRHTIGSSYLILIDGVKFNHLYNNETEVMATFPLSNIKYIEIVHGAASVAYGNDAVVGIINVITNKEKEGFNGFIQAGEHNNQVLDFNYQKKWSTTQFTLSGRYDHGDVDFTNAASYQWTNPSLLKNKDIWGSFVDSFSDLQSPHYNKALNASLIHNKAEFTLQYYQLATGYGLIYTFDHSLPNAGLWSETEYSAHYRQQFDLTEYLSLKTFLRYRSSNIDNDSLFIEGYTTSTENNQQQRLLDASYWQSNNNSNSASGELTWQVNKNWSVLAGAELEFKRLQKAYNINYGASLPPNLIDASYQLPLPPTHDTVPNNHKKTTQRNVYLLSRYNLPNFNNAINQKLHLGIRRDHHSVFGTETTIRAGWVGQLDKTTLKLFYGEAYQEPSARLLYGGWKGSGSDPNLKPRNANTWEFNINYKLDELLLSSNIYRMHSSNLFNTTDNAAINSGNGVTTGGDVRLKYQPLVQNLTNLSFWAAYTWLNTKEQTSDLNDILIWHKDTDVANRTVHFGSYITLTKQWQINLRGRYYGDRNTISSNKTRTIKNYITLDANINYQWTPQVKIALDVTNLFNERYFHPGMRSASASNDNSTFNNNVWVGSQSFYNAKIAQPAREIKLSLYWQW